MKSRSIAGLKQQIHAEVVMPHFLLFDLIKWLHFACFTIAGGASIVAVLLSGLEDDREDLRGLAATLWKKLVSWAFRLAVITGILLLALLINRGDLPFDARYLPLKLALVFILLIMSELSFKALARAKRGAPLLVVLMFLLSTFVAINREAFGHKLRIASPPAEVSAGPAS
jgi:hypothetical protein